ncbi:MAG: ribonuclease HIII [Kiritimatiellae bacterium]|jgi:ribonuclease HIII|nr:ribonuclease HIII [Kiritimatiellia bacterium]
MAKQNSFTYKLSKEQQQTLISILQDGIFTKTEVPYTTYSAKGNDCSINIYTSGKCLIQGKGAEDFILFYLEPLVTQVATLGYEDVINPEAIQPHCGIDESGKGDLFGPLVISSVYVDDSIVPKLREMGVKDSKNITSDAKALGMGKALREMLQGKFSIVKVGPEAYNRLYTKMRSVNTLLAWGHARSIENILDLVPTCPTAISDQFGTKEQLEKALMKKGNNIELIQRHKAEADMAVAAASIIAREQFLLALKAFEKTYDQEFPKGASAKVKELAIKLVEKNGPQVLEKTAKCHFKTTDQVLEAAGYKRSDLGEFGQAMSKTITNSKWKKSKKQ